MTDSGKMYYPVGLPKRLRIPGASDGQVKAIVCNRDRILFAVVTEKSIWIWFSRVSIPLVIGQFIVISSLARVGVLRVRVEYKLKPNLVVFD